MAITTACSSATHSIGEAFRMIKHGYLELAVTGGVEAPISPIAVAGFAAMRAMSTNNDDPQGAMRPFDKTRDGFVMGEGAGILVLETLENAQNRGAHIYGEIIGYGSTSDAFHMTAPAENGEGAAMAMRLAIEEAGLEPAQIDYINAHGTSTPVKRQAGNPGHQNRIRGRRKESGRQFDQVDDRAFAGCGRRGRGDCHAACHGRGKDPAHAELPGTRSGMRSVLCTQ